MSPRTRGLLLFFVVVLTAGRAVAQSLPPAPVPATLPPFTPPPPPPPAVYQEPLPNHDGLLDAPAGSCGWFGEAGVSILKAHVKNRLSADVSFGDLGTDTVYLPGASLDWTAAPTFELGYRFADGCGELVGSYRNLTTSGRATIVDYDALGDGFLRSRLDVNTFDFDYGNTITLGSRLDLRWRAGVRVADVFFDSHAVGQFLEQHVSNHFTGAGPHAAFDAWYRLPVPGLGLYARLDGALPVGHIHQGFSESFTFDDGSVLGSGASQGTTQVVPTLDAQLGFGWAPPGTRLRFLVGYEFEQWWNVGHVGSSRAELFDQGVFFRAEFSF
jgi:hypothetical protein